MDIINEMLEEIKSNMDEKRVIPPNSSITFDKTYTNQHTPYLSLVRIISLLEEISKKLDSKEVSASTVGEERGKYSFPEFELTSVQNYSVGNHIVVSSTEESGLTRKQFNEFVSQLQILKVVHGDSVDINYISKNEVKVGNISIKFVEGGR